MGTRWGFLETSQGWWDMDQQHHPTPVSLHYSCLRKGLFDTNVIVEDMEVQREVTLVKDNPQWNYWGLKDKYEL